MKSEPSRTSTVLTVDELAVRWGVDRKSIYLQIQRGNLPVMRIGRSIRIPLTLVQEYEQGSAVERS